MSNAIGIPSARKKPKKSSLPVNFLKRLWKEKPLGIVAGTIIVLLTLVAIFADVITQIKRYGGQTAGSSGTVE